MREANYLPILLTWCAYAQDKPRLDESNRRYCFYTSNSFLHVGTAPSQPASVKRASEKTFVPLSFQYIFCRLSLCLYDWWDQPTCPSYSPISLLEFLSQTHGYSTHANQRRKLQQSQLRTDNQRSTDATITMHDCTKPNNRMCPSTPAIRRAHSRG